QNHDHRRESDEAADRDDLRGPGGPDELERARQRRRVELGEVGVGDHPGDDDGDEDVEDGHDQEPQHDPAGHGALGVLGLLGAGGHDVEADEREEHQRGAAEDPEDAVHGRIRACHEREQRLGPYAVGGWPGLGGRDERGEVRRVHEEEADDDHEQHDPDLDDREHRVHPARQARAEREQQREDRHDDHGSPVEGQGADRDGHRDVQVEERDRVAEVHAPVLRDHGRGHEHLEDEVPADDPGEELAQRRVGERVGGAR
ncbi:hypothetical protein ABE10_02860, partial [Bacillus toyonensis]|nr:hypothetical protein [Bacillus toyonensis]